MAGLLDNPNDAMMMQMGLGLLSAGGPSRMPVSLGQAIGSSGQGAMDAYRQAQEFAQRKKTKDMQDQIMQMQLTKMMEEQARQKQIEQAAQGAYTQPSQGQIGFGLPMQSQQTEQLMNQMSGDQGFDKANLGAINQAAGSVAPMGADTGFRMPSQGGFDQSKFIDELSRIDPLKAIEFRQKMAKESPFDKINPKDFTPESLSKFSLTKDYSSLVPLDKANPNRPFNSDGTPNKEYQAYEIRKAQAGASNVSLGAPHSVINPNTGKPEFALFPNKPGAQPQFTGLAPAPEIGKPPTEQEAKAAFYAQNMLAASDVLEKMESSGFDPTSAASQVKTSLAGGITNPMAGKDAQKARQAQNQWAEQMLRMQTGAAATADEIRRTVATYFPTIGDTKDAVDQKRMMRKQAEAGVISASGRAQERIAKPQPIGEQYGTPPPGAVRLKGR